MDGCIECYVLKSPETGQNRNWSPYGSPSMTNWDIQGMATPIYCICCIRSNVGRIRHAGKYPLWCREFYTHKTRLGVDRPVSKSDSAEWTDCRVSWYQEAGGIEWRGRTEQIELNTFFARQNIKSWRPWHAVLNNSWYWGNRYPDCYYRVLSSISILNLLSTPTLIYPRPSCC